MMSHLPIKGVACLNLGHFSPVSTGARIIGAEVVVYLVQEPSRICDCFNQVRQSLCTLLIVEPTLALLQISPYTVTGLLVRRKVMFRLSLAASHLITGVTNCRAAGGVLLSFCCVTIIGIPGGLPRTTTHFLFGLTPSGL